MKTIEEIANEIIGYSSGSFSIGWTEDYEQLNAEDKADVEDIVSQEIDACDVCGWYWHNNDMELTEDYGKICWQCEKRLEEEGEYED